MIRHLARQAVAATIRAINEANGCEVWRDPK